MKHREHARPAGAPPDTAQPTAAQERALTARMAAQLERELGVGVLSGELDSAAGIEPAAGGGPRPGLRPGARLKADGGYLERGIKSGAAARETLAFPFDQEGEGSALLMGQSFGSAASYT